MTVTKVQPLAEATADADLQEGWTLSTLRDVTDAVPNVNPKSEPDRDFGYIDISSIDNRAFEIVDQKQFKGIAAPSRARRPIQPGDVLFSNVRTYLRNVAIVPMNCSAQLCSTGFTVIRAHGAADRRYLFYYALTDDFVDSVTEQQTGSNYPATNDRKVLASAIPIPPLPEQKRIVAKVEELLAEVNKARERLTKVPPILKRFRQSVLAAACSGRLTEDWRTTHTLPKIPSGVGIRSVDLPDLPQSWCWVPTESVADVIDPHPSHRTPPVTPDGIPYVGMSNVTENGDIDFASARKVSKKVFEEHRERYQLSEGDFIFGKIGTLGKPAKLPQPFNYTLSANIVLVQPKATVTHSDFVFFYTQTSFIELLLTQESRASSQPAFGIKRIRKLPFPLPPCPEQKEIVRRVEALFNVAEEIEKRVETATTRTEKLTQSILAKAFRGELVPTEAELARKENRTYEPASVLLEKIKAERATQTKATKRLQPKTRKRDAEN